MARIAIIAAGSRGDVQPYLALGKGLQQSGHSIRIVTYLNFGAMVEAHGLEFWPIEADVQDIVERQDMRALVEGGNFLSLLSQMAKEAQKGALLLAESGLAASRGMDLILAGLGGAFTGIAVAEKLGIPFIQAYIQPLTPTRQFPGALTPELPVLFGSSLNRLSHHMVRLMMWQGFRQADTIARKQILGLSPAPLSGPYNSPSTREMPLLYGFSPSVIAKPSDWGENIHVTGYWFLDSEEGWTPPPALLEFLEVGPRPVYIGFGSMSNRDPRQTADLVIEALKRSGQRAVVLSGWGGMQKSDLPDSVFMVDSIPHDWLFPRMAAVVHHGGAGTTAAGLRAGVPSVIVPFFGDQPFWGQRVFDLGAGPQPIPRKQLTVERLASALRAAVSDPAMRRCASDLGARIRNENGVAAAVDIVNGINL